MIMIKAQEQPKVENGRSCAGVENLVPCGLHSAVHYPVYQFVPKNIAARNFKRNFCQIACF